MKERKLKIVSMVCLICLLLSSMVFAVGDSELADIYRKLNNLDGQLQKGKKLSSQYSSEIKALNNKINAAEKEINALQSDISSTKKQISAALSELERLESEMSEQTESLESRLRAMYKNGDVGIMGVLLGSNSMSDFLTNVEMVKRIYQSDAQTLEDLENDYADIRTKREQLMALKEKLLSRQEEAKDKENALAADKASVANKKNAQDASNKELAKQIDALNAEADKITAQLKGNTSTGSYAGGGMCWPSAASKKITSLFGNRLHPILKVNKMHTGIDIGASYGSNILAANSGTIITAGWNSGYGNYIMIDHGGGIVTLYAHSSKLLVKKGDRVVKGQAIALVGSTGMSTGAHLHFEVRVDGAYKNPLNYVSP